MIHCYPGWRSPLMRNEQCLTALCPEVGENSLRERNLSQGPVVNRAPGPGWGNAGCGTIPEGPDRLQLHVQIAVL